MQQSTMTNNSSLIGVLSSLSYDRLSRKPILFNSFSGIALKEYENRYKKIKKYISNMRYSLQEHPKVWSLDKTMLTNSKENIPDNKKVENHSRNWKTFSWSYGLYRLYIVQQLMQSRPKNNTRRKMYFSSGNRNRHTSKSQLVVNNQGIILHK